MTDVQDRKRPAFARRPAPSGPGGAAAGLPTRQRRPGYVALAVVLIVGLAALGGYLYTQAGAKVPVVVVVRDVPAGHRIARADLSTVQVAGAVTAVGGGNLDSVVGQTAVVELLPNTLLQRAMVSSASSLAGGLVQVGVQVKPGQIPAAGLAPGDRVEVVQLPDRDATASGSRVGSASVLVRSATVYSVVADPSQAGGTLLTLVVTRAVATAVAAASASGLVALVRVGP